MIELNFIKYLIKLSKKYDPSEHIYIPNNELRKYYNEIISKKYNINQKNIINIRINLDYDNDYNIKKLLEIKNYIISLKKKFILCPCKIFSKNISHAILIIYYKNINKLFYQSYVNRISRNFTKS